MDELVLYVPFPMLHPAVDIDRLQRIVPSVTVVCDPVFDIDHNERTLREQAPFADSTRALAVPLTDAQRDAFGRANVVWTLDVPLDLGTVAPELRFVQAIGSGVGQFVASGLPEAGIALSNGAGIGAPPIAEWVIARVLQILKGLDTHDANAREHRWESALGSNLQGRTMAIIGLGAIGRETARRARAFGVHLLGLRRSWKPGMNDDDVDEVFGPDDLHNVLSRSNVVVLCAPGTDETEDMFDAAAFAAMPDGSIFVNVGRGTLVDEAALIASLESGHLRAAAIDVARTEPLPAEDPLWDAPNLFISPHSSTSGEGYADRAFDLLCTNLERLVNGKPLTNAIDLTNGY